MSLNARRVVLAVTGGIAAYKVPLILRGLQRHGMDVRVVMSENAHRFVAASPLEVLSRHPVHTDIFAADAEFSVLHVGLAGWAEVVLVAPATARLLAKMAHGLADDLLSCLLLATTAPVLLAPSMEEHMLGNAATQANLATLRQRGCEIIEPDIGELASGTSGRGRLPEPADLVRRVVARLEGTRDMSGLRVLVTAGPTYEDIDPVRYIGNRSSGKMGYALASRACARGASVHLISGPTALTVPAGIECEFVRSTCQLQAATDAAFGAADIAIMAAAPSDFRPRCPASDKIRREADGLRIELVANPDVAAGLGNRKTAGQQLVIFALECDAGEQRARAKLAQKKADLVVLNSLKDEGAGFEVDTNVVSLFGSDGSSERLPRLDKQQVADRILDWVMNHRHVPVSGGTPGTGDEA